MSLGLGNVLHISNQRLGSRDCGVLCGSPNLAQLFPSAALVPLEVIVSLLWGSYSLEQDQSVCGGSAGPLDPVGFWAE